MPRKRTHDEIAASDPAVPPVEHTLLHKIRNAWEFAAFYEWLAIFGWVVKVDLLDIEDYEHECVKSGPSKWLEETGLAILKFVSSRRDLTLENWDETVRRQYEFKREGKPHPYGEEDEADKFNNFHILTKLRVLYQLAAWTFQNPDRMRQHFGEHKEMDQFYDWQAHPVGWDRHANTYFALQGNRLYRRIDPPLPAEQPKSKSKQKTTKKYQGQRRRGRMSKRRKVAAESEDEDTEMADDELNETAIDDTEEQPRTGQSEDKDPETVNTYGEYKWECVAITLDEFNNFISMIKSKDPDEKALKAYVESEMLPELERARERRERKEAERLRELHMVEKMQGAKRSGRLAAKQEREKEEAEHAEAERHHKALLAEARREQQRQSKMEDDRKSRMQTREQRIRERELNRVLLEEQLARDSEDEKRLEDEGGARGTRNLKERIKKNKRQLEEWVDDEWSFDCAACGQHGKNFDDGEHSIACEQCNVWQHSKCLGFSKQAAESENFHFVCKDCKRREEDAKRPKISLKFKIGNSSSPPQPTLTSPTNTKLESPSKLPSFPVNALAASRPSQGPVNGTFHPTIVSSNRPLFQPSGQPSVQPSQPSLPAYTQRPIPKAMPYMNGGPPYPYNTQNASNAVPAYVPSLPQPYQPSGPTLQQYQSQVRPVSSHHHQTPRPMSSQTYQNGHSSPVRQRIPSPVMNPPMMSPTQGNPEVGPIAGVPGSSPSMQYATMNTPYANGHDQKQIPQSTPQQSHSRHASFSMSQSGGHQFSGLSPTKQSVSAVASPLPQPTLIPQKMPHHDAPYATPSSTFNNETRMRSVSGTPIFPPAEKLAPSPHQLNRDPVPTPSKHSPPLQQGSFDVAQPDPRPAQLENAQ